MNYHSEKIKRSHRGLRFKPDWGKDRDILREAVKEYIEYTEAWGQLVSLLMVHPLDRVEEQKRKLTEHLEKLSIDKRKEIEYSKKLEE